MSIRDMTVQQLLDRGIRVEIVDFADFDTTYDDAFQKLVDYGITDFEYHESHNIKWLRHRSDQLDVSVFYRNEDDINERVTS